jgi:hypothetical protein
MSGSLRLLRASIAAACASQETNGPGFYGDIDQKLGGPAPPIGSQLVYCVGRLLAPAKKLRVSRRLSIEAFHHAVSIRQIAEDRKNRNSNDAQELVRVSMHFALVRRLGALPIKLKAGVPPDDSICLNRSAVAFLHLYSSCFKIQF